MDDRREKIDPAVESALAEELLAIHIDSYGKGAGRTTVHLLDDAVICFLDDLELQRSEHFLIEAGRGDTVTQVRSDYQAAIETTFRAAVERATGRRVISFASVTKLSPNYVIEIFRLAPREESGKDGLRDG